MKKGSWFGLKIYAASAQQNIALVAFTEVVSPQSVKIDEVPHHVKDLRPVTKAILRIVSV